MTDLDRGGGETADVGLLVNVIINICDTAVGKSSVRVAPVTVGSRLWKTGCWWGDMWME